MGSGFFVDRADFVKIVIEIDSSIFVRRPEWARPEPPPQPVLVLPAPRGARLLVPRRELLVELCALHLPADDVLRSAPPRSPTGRPRPPSIPAGVSPRVRKRFRVQNVGDGYLHATVTAGEPWSVVRGESGPACGAGCARLERGRRVRTAALCLPPRSAAEVAVEIAVRAANVWPAPAASLASLAPESPVGGPAAAAGAGAPAYPERLEIVDALTFADAATVLQVSATARPRQPPLRAVTNVFDIRYSEVVTRHETQNLNLSPLLLKVISR